MKTFIVLLLLSVSTLAEQGFNLRQTPQFSQSTTTTPTKLPFTEDDIAVEGESRQRSLASLPPTITPSHIPTHTFTPITYVYKKASAINTNLPVLLNALSTQIKQPMTSINWDGGAVGSQITSPNKFNAIQGDTFLHTAPRQLFFHNPNDGLFASTDGFKAGFGKNVGTNAFSNNINVAPLATNTATIGFSTPGQIATGLVPFFGAIFTDVEKNLASGLKFYGATGELLLALAAPTVPNGEHVFVGAYFGADVVASVEVICGDNGNLDTTKSEGKNNDFVVVDDFFFSLSDVEVPTVTYRDWVTPAHQPSIDWFNKRNAAGNYTADVTSINWDAGAITALTNGGTSSISRDFFFTGGGLRQVKIFGPTEHGAVSENGFGYSGDGLGAFSPTVAFAPKPGSGEKSLTATFFTDTGAAGLINGFGCIFTDVEVGLKAGLKFYDHSGHEIMEIFAEPGKNKAHEFLGVMYARPTIRAVEILFGDDNRMTAGGTTPHENVGTGVDYVSVDDWFFSKSKTAA